MITKIEKRDKTIKDFDVKKIENAIFRAAQAVGGTDKILAGELAYKVAAEVEKTFYDKTPTVEDVQDMVEKVLIEERHAKTAKAYILYRAKKTEEREKRAELMGSMEKAAQNLNFTNNSMRVLERRYLRKDNDGNLIETPKEMVRRVAKNIAKADGFYGGDATKTEEEFYDMIKELEFLPNSPTLMNAGNDLQQLSACFVLPVEDSMEGIFDAIKNTALVHKSGGGTGFSFSRLRPGGSVVRSTSGVASGPISFMKVFDAATEVIKQGGKRRGANMGVLRIDHPNIVDFINCKADMQSMTNFNISVGVTDKFMEAVLNDEDYELFNPKTQNVDGKYRAKNIFSMIVQNAWKNGDPGIMFLDEINRKHAAKHLGDIESTNPCVTGDSLVAVADGRDYIPIKQLAEEGKDIPIYCYGNEGITVRMGRNPRLTRKKTNVYEVVLDDESSIKATEDHKFMLRNGEYKELKDLKEGDSLMPFNKYVYNSKKRRSNYWRVCLNNGKTRGEHFLVMENKEGKPIDHRVELVHHKDFNGLNNAPDNLEVMSYSEHSRIHQRGENNVMKGKWWHKLSEEEKQKYRKNMSKALEGEKNPRWGTTIPKRIRNKISQSLKKHYSDPKNRERARQIAKENSWKTTQKLKGVKKVERVIVKCQHCNSKKEMLPSEYRNRQKSNQFLFCSRSCANSYYKKGFKHKIETKKKIKDKLQLICSTKEAKVKRRYAGKVNFKKRAMQIAKHFEKEGIIFHEGNWDNLKENYPERYATSQKIVENFGSFNKFKQKAKYNHTVSAINFYGLEDVYNITVDEFHNVCYVTSDERFKGTGVFETFNSAKGRKYSKIFSHKRFISGIVTKNCGEVPLLPYESCNLGSINLHRFVAMDRKDLDWERLEKCVRSATHFLDNVIDMNKAPLKQIQDMNAKTRKIGLGIMGFADMLYELGIPYDSEEGLAMAEKTMGFVNDISHDESQRLAEIRGVYPAWEGSDHQKEGKRMRNATCTTIAPTGTVGMIAETSGGCEPNFAISFIKNVMDGTELVYTNKIFERVAKERGFFTQELMKKVARAGTVQGFEEIPEDVRNVFVCAQDITPEWHIRMQAAFQKHIDNAISKTVNFPNNATIDDVEQVYMLAYQLNCKGVTIYRDGCRDNQVLNIGSVNTKKKKEMEKAYEDKKEKESLSKSDTIEEGKCPECGSKLAKEEGCNKCYACGFSACSV